MGAGILHTVKSLRYNTLRGKWTIYGLSGVTRSGRGARGRPRLMGEKSIAGLRVRVLVGAVYPQSKNRHR